MPAPNQSSGKCMIVMLLLCYFHVFRYEYMPNVSRGEIVGFLKSCGGGGDIIVLVMAEIKK